MFQPLSEFPKHKWLHCRHRWYWLARRDYSQIHWQLPVSHRPTRFSRRDSDSRWSVPDRTTTVLRSPLRHRISHEAYWPKRGQNQFQSPSPSLYRWSLTSPNRINFTRSETSRGGLAFGNWKVFFNVGVRTEHRMRMMIGCFLPPSCTYVMTWWWTCPSMKDSMYEESNLILDWHCLRLLNVSVDWSASSLEDEDLVEQIPNRNRIEWYYACRGTIDHQRVSMIWSLSLVFDSSQSTRWEWEIGKEMRQDKMTHNLKKRMSNHQGNEEIDRWNKRREETRGRRKNKFSKSFVSFRLIILWFFILCLGVTADGNSSDLCITSFSFKCAKKTNQVILFFFSPAVYWGQKSCGSHWTFSHLTWNSNFQNGPDWKNPSFSSKDDRLKTKIRRQKIRSHIA